MRLLLLRFFASPRLRFLFFAAACMPAQAPTFSRAAKRLLQHALRGKLMVVFRWHCFAPAICHAFSLHAAATPPFRASSPPPLRRCARVDVTRVARCRRHARRVFFFFFSLISIDVISAAAIFHFRCSLRVRHTRCASPSFICHACHYSEAGLSSLMPAA